MYVALDPNEQFGPGELPFRDLVLNWHSKIKLQIGPRRDMDVVECWVGIANSQRLAGSHRHYIRLEETTDIVQYWRLTLNRDRTTINPLLNINQHIGEPTFGRDDIMAGGDWFWMKLATDRIKVDWNLWWRCSNQSYPASNYRSPCSARSHNRNHSAVDQRHRSRINRRGPVR